MLHGVSQAQGAARTLAACTGHSSTHTPFGLSPPGQQPDVIARPLAARKRGTAGHWGQFLTVSEPLQLLLGRRQATAAALAPWQAARPGPLLSEHGHDVCMWSARSSAAIGRMAFFQAQKQVRDHHPERPQARQGRHQ